MLKGKKKKKKKKACVLLYSRCLRLQALPTTVPPAAVHHLEQNCDATKTGWLQRWSWSNINYNARGLPPTWRYQIICKRSQDGGHAEGRHKLISLSFQLSTPVSVHQLVWSLLYEFSWVCSVGLLILLTMFSPVYWGGEMFHLFLLFCLCHVGLCPPPPKSILSFF